MSQETTRGGKHVPDLSQAVWHRSGSEGSRGVEVAFADGMIALRDSRNPDGPALIFTQAEWDAFVAGVNDGEFDLH